MQLMPGQLVGPYRLVEPAGTGGMAEVWRAYDARRDRSVAIKLLAPDHTDQREYRERFRREAQAIARLDHPNILTLLDFGEHECWTYLVSPEVDGGTLAGRLLRGPWPIADALAVLNPLASALDYAHRAGIVHRDVKPSNVLLSERGRVALSDFGAAWMLEASTLPGETGLMIGSPRYTSPEQAQGRPAGPASDVYSLGVIAYEMLTGLPPFEDETASGLQRAHAELSPPPPSAANPSLSPGVQAALYRVLAKRPEDRYRRAADFVAELRVAGQSPFDTAPAMAGPGAVGVAEAVPSAPPHQGPRSEPARAPAPPPRFAPDGPAPPQLQPTLLPPPPIGNVTPHPTLADAAAGTAPAGQVRPAWGVSRLVAAGVGVVVVGILLGMGPVNGLVRGAASAKAETRTEPVAAITTATPPRLPATPPSHTQLPVAQASATAWTPAADAPLRQPDERPVIFAEDFDVPARAKLDPPSPTDASVFRIEYYDGGYRMAKLDPTKDIAWLQILKPLFADGMISVDARLVGDLIDRTIILACRYDVATRHQYRLVISPELSRAILFRIDDRGIVRLAYADHPVIRPGTEVNRIAFLCQGNTLTGYVNGERIVTAQDDDLDLGWWGFGVGNSPGLVGPLEARFDNLTLSTPQ